MVLSMLWTAQDYAAAFDVARIFRLLGFDILLRHLGSHPENRRNSLCRAHAFAFSPARD
jgi:hypothetical protein